MFPPKWLSFLFFQFCVSFAAALTPSLTDTIVPTKSITDGQIIVSAGSNYALGFFSPGTSSYRYVRIWYHKEEEKMLIYEYTPNKSLNAFIFVWPDKGKRALLDWRKIYEIIVGIARGVLYLHQDSRLRIIHRDLKATNVLLDEEMNSKISDFGMARILKSSKYKESGWNIVWDLWKECRILETVDSSMGDTYPTHEVSRCIQVGLLCVQESATDRPTMSSVIFMLGNEKDLPMPNQPALIMKTTLKGQDSSTLETGSCSTNKVTITDVDHR